MIFVCLCIMLSILTFALGFIVAVNIETNANDSYKYDLIQYYRLQETINYNRSNSIRLDSFFRNRGYNKILIWGAGFMYREMAKDMTMNDYDIQLLDINPDEKKGIISPLHFTRYDDYDVLVITTTKNEKEVLRLVEQMNLKIDTVTYKELVYNAERE